MIEFKANGYVPKTANDLAAEHYERAKSGKNNPAFFAGATHVIRLEYQPLYNAYTTTSAELDYYKNRVEAAEKGRTDSTNAHVQTIAELETVKAELEQAKRTVSDLHVGIKEILYNLEDAKQDLKDANKYMLEAAKLNP